LTKDNGLLQAALNGDREHPTVPRTPEELAAEACEAVEAGAGSLHLHPYDDHGHQTLAAEPCAAALRSVRAALRPRRVPRSPRISQHLGGHRARS